MHDGRLLGKPSPREPQPQAPGELRDKVFAGAFVVNAVAVGLLAVTLGLPNASDLDFTAHEQHHAGWSHGLKAAAIFLATALLGAGVSALWLQLLQRHAAGVIDWTLRLSVVAFVAGAIVAFHDSGMAGRAIGFVNLFLALAMGVFYINARRSVAFAASNLSTASQILRQFPEVVYTAYGALVVQIAWILVWSLAALGVLATSVGHLRDSTSFGNICFFLMLLSLFWFVQVTKNVVHCVAAGAVGEWWFGAQDRETVHRARSRALTISFGSICLGSLLVAALNALHTLLHLAPRRKSRSSANAFLESIVKFVARSVQYCNKFAFCQVAIYGKSFYAAGMDAMSLFRDRGWTALLNDSLISGVLSIGCLVVGAVSGVVGSAWMHLALKCTEHEAAAHKDECETFNVVVLTFLTCASIGYAMCAIVSSVLDSIVATVFVCFAEDPAALQKTHPETHERLVNAWGRLKPELLTHPAHLV